MLRVYCPLLSEDRLDGTNVPELLHRLEQDVQQLVDMMAPKSNAAVREVLEFVRAREIADLDERFEEYLQGNADIDEEDDERSSEAKAALGFLACAATELWGYRIYTEDESPFATQQGIKGAEFDRVLVVLDDEESDYNLFSYGKYFGMVALSERDIENIANGLNSVISRTRRLFYVCCSRAMRDLAVVLFVPDVRAAHAALSGKGFFSPECLHVNVE